MKLEGKSAIVTGASRGIGLAITEMLLKEGAKVALISRSLGKKILWLDPDRTIFLAADVSLYDEVVESVHIVLRAWKRVDILVNNAGAVGHIGRLEGSHPLEWQQAFAVNVFGTANTCRSVLPTMRKQRSGKIVNIAGGGIGGPRIDPLLTSYTSSKAAVVQLTASLAAEVKDNGIQVNAVSPGSVRTKMSEELERTGILQRWDDSAEKTAEMVAWLASDASGDLTGKLLSAKWDRVKDMEVDLDMEHEGTASANGSSLYTLRRIDNLMYSQRPRWEEGE